MNAEKTGSRTHGHPSWLRGEKESSQTGTPFLAPGLQARITEAPVGPVQQAESYLPICGMQAWTRERSEQ